MKFIILFLSLGLLLSCYGKKPEQTGKEGKDLPYFELLLPDSVTLINTKEIKPGKPIVLFFFGPNCPFSRSQMEEIVNHINELKNIQFYLLTVSSISEAMNFYSDFNLRKYPNIITGRDINYFFMRYFNAKGVPTIAVYGDDKKLKSVFLGEVSASEIKETAIAR